MVIYYFLFEILQFLFQFCLRSNDKCSCVNVIVYNRSYYSGVVISLGVERSEFRIPVGARNLYLVQEEHKLALGSYQISIQWVSGFPHRR